MADRGNITYHLFEGEYDDSEIGYKVESQIIMNYYSDLGYYMALDIDFWNSFFEFLALKISESINIPKNSDYELTSEYDKKEYYSFINIDKLRSFITEFSKIFDKKDSMNIRAFFNNVDIDSSSLFNDFIEPFFNKQNKKVKKSFLHAKRLNSLDKDLGYEYFAMFYDYFGNRFTNLVDKELEKRGISEKFSTIDVIGSLFSKFSDDFLWSLFERFSSDMEGLLFFKFILVSNSGEMFFVLPWRESERKLISFDILWIDFLLNSGFNVEIFAFNKSNEEMSNIVNRFKENEINLELFDFDGNSKLVINDFKELKNLNKEDGILKVDGYELDFDDVHDVVSCILEYQKSGSSMDYCLNYNGYENSVFPCWYLEKYFKSITNVNEGFINITDKGVVKFDKDKYSNKFNELSKTLKVCPYFDYSANKERLPVFFKDLTPIYEEGCCFVDCDNHAWQCLDKFYYCYDGDDDDLYDVWFNEEGSLDFPGFSKMVTLKVMDDETEEKALELAFKNLKKRVK